MWNAKYDGGIIELYDMKDGQLLQRVDVPVSCVTCATFGGPDLDWLFITSGTKKDEKGSGGIFIAKVETPGRPEALFNDLKRL